MHNIWIWILDHCFFSDSGFLFVQRLGIDRGLAETMAVEILDNTWIWIIADFGFRILDSYLYNGWGLIGVWRRQWPLRFSTKGSKVCVK